MSIAIRIRSINRDFLFWMDLLFLADQMGLDVTTFSSLLRIQMDLR